jgi:phospholipase/lecithinase/hemolysin
MRLVTLVALCVVLLASGSVALADPVDRMVVFGDSLSDPGNHFAAFGQTSHAPFAPLPDFPYAIGGHHFSNGPTWIEQLAHALDMPLSGKPALRAPGVFTNYAVGRARARAGADAFPYFALGTQVRQFLTDFRGQAPSEAVYVIWIGANDLNDALTAGQTDPARAGEIIRAAVTTQAEAVYALWAAGARQFMVLNVPDPALAPFVRALPLPLQAAATQAGLLYNGSRRSSIASSPVTTATVWSTSRSPA